MTNTEVEIESELRTTWPDAHLTSPPVPVTGGQWATMFRLAVEGTPDGVPTDLVLRVVPHAAMGAKELAVQRAAANAGVPTPAVRLTGLEGGALGGAWAVMDFAPGVPLLAGLDGFDAVRRFPQIVRRLPRQLAETMASVHQIAPEPVIGAVRQASPSVAFTVDELWPHLHAAAEMTGEASLVAAIGAMVATQPDQSEGVLCHGDLHPFNVLAEGDRVTVLDWTGALVAPAAFDVALTWLLLRYPPLETSAALRPVIDTAGRVLARRFVRRYRAANPAADLTRFDWYTALHAARVLVDLASWRRDGDPQAATHPWSLVAPGAAEVLARATGVELTLSAA